MEEYLESKFSSDIKHVGGELLCDPEKKEMTVLQTSRYMKISTPAVYNLLSKGALKGCHKGKYWVITEPDILEYLESKEDKQQMRFA